MVYELYLLLHWMSSSFARIDWLPRSRQRIRITLYDSLGSSISFSASSETRVWFRVPLKIASTCSRFPRTSLGAVLSGSISFSTKQLLLCHGRELPSLTGRKRTTHKNFKSFKLKQSSLRVLGVKLVYSKVVGSSSIRYFGEFNFCY